MTLETIRDLQRGRAVTAHFGEITDAAWVTAECNDYEVVRARGNTIEHAVYVVGEHFGIWCLDSQWTAEENSVWLEDSPITDEHLKLAEEYGIEFGQVEVT